MGCPVARAKVALACVLTAGSAWTLWWQYKTQDASATRQPPLQAVLGARASQAQHGKTVATQWSPKCKPQYPPESKRTYGASGNFVMSSCTGMYILDKGFARALARVVNGSVLELGAGCGCYTAFLRDFGGIEDIVAVDGVPNIDNLTHGLVRHWDLCNLWPVDASRLFDWTLSLAVAEHVPQQCEEAVFTNIVHYARVGAVIMWGSGRKSEKEPNVHHEGYVANRMAAWGFVYDEAASDLLRSGASAKLTSWFHVATMVFRRASSPITAIAD